MDKSIITPEFLRPYLCCQVESFSMLKFLHLFGHESASHALYGAETETRDVHKTSIFTHRNLYSSE